jgi:flagellar biosynthetic protein FlhB
MAEPADKDSRTEQATEKRIQDAIERGRFPVARDPAIAAALVGTWFAFAYLVGDTATALVRTLTVLLAEVSEVAIDGPGDVIALLGVVLGASLGTCALILAALAIPSLAASIAQLRRLLSWQRLSPEASRISPIAGARRLFAATNLQEFFKTCLKLSIVTAAAYAVCSQGAEEIADLVGRDARDIPVVAATKAQRLVALIAIGIGVVALFDLIAARWSWQRSLRMTLQEVRDELKEDNGDPQLVARRKVVSRRRIQVSLRQSVPRATLIVTNPTHFAVALRYRRDEGGAPKVVAKGADSLAHTIRDIARRHDIPIVESKVLARALFDQVGVDQHIPPEFYRAVADILIALRHRHRAPIGGEARP